MNNTNNKSAELDKTEERILRYIYQWGDTDVNIGEIQAYLPEISDENFNFYIEELMRNGYLKKSRTGDLVWLTNLGKEYCTKDKLMPYKDTAKHTCKAKTKKNEACKKQTMKNSDYCYLHSFGKIKGIPWHKNSTFHIVITIVLTIFLFLIGPSRTNQEQMLENDKETHNKLDRIIDKDKTSEKSYTPEVIDQETPIDNKTGEIAKLVSTLEKLLSKDMVEIKSPDYIEDKSIGELREVDISIKKMVGSVPILVIIECKDDSIVNDTLWIEQIAQKKDAINASKAVAVFNGYLSDSAKQKAHHLNIETRLISKITPDDISGWFQVEYLNQWIYQVDFLSVSFRTDDKNQEQLYEFVKSDGFKKKFNANEKLFLNTGDNKKYTFNHIWKGMLSKKKDEIYQDVKPGGLKVRRTLFASFSNSESRYQLITDKDNIDILEIKEICDLWIEEKHLPFTLSQYSSQDDQLVESAGVKFEAEGIEYNINLHKDIKTGNMYISSDNLFDVKFDFNEIKKDEISK